MSVIKDNSSADELEKDTPVVWKNVKRTRRNERYFEKMKKVELCGMEKIGTSDNNRDITIAILRDRW